MKFGKEFASQMVPEWQEAYMDYDYLKTLLKEVLRFRQRNSDSKPASAQSGPIGGLKRKLTLYRTFSGLTQRANNVDSKSKNDIENQAILVSSVNQNGPQSYQTAFLMASDEGGEYELVYFRRLDDEFNKVNSFYKSKVDEVLKEADTLNKQMDAFIAFRIKVENPTGWSSGDRAEEMSRLASDVAASAAALDATTPKGAKAGNVIEEGSSNSHEGSSDKMEKKNHKVKEVKVQIPAQLEILHHVHMNNTLETPRSTIKGFLKVPGHTNLRFTRGNLRKVEKQLKRAFVDQKLRLLRSYSFLNTFTMGERRLRMSISRPKTKTERHRISFTMGERRFRHKELLHC